MARDEVSLLCERNGSEGVKDIHTYQDPRINSMRVNLPYCSSHTTTTLKLRDVKKKTALLNCFCIVRRSGASVRSLCCQQFGKLCHFWPNLDLDDVITNGIEDQLTHGVDAQFAHDIRPVSFYCFYT